jgi:hypothetical protein
MLVRSFALITLGAGLAVGIAACGADSDPGTGAAQSFRPPTAASSAAASPAVSSPAAAAASKPTAATPSGTGCPVTEARLMAAWKEKVSATPRKGMTLTRIRCHDGYAITVNTVPRFDTEIEVFRYTSGSWRYFTGGSGGYCEGVPADVTKRFRGMGYPGCD